MNSATSAGSQEGGGSGACPVCGSATSGYSVEELQDHFDAHTKQDLIQLLIQQQNCTKINSHEEGEHTCLDFIPTTENAPPVIIQYSTLESTPQNSQESYNFDIVPHHSGRSSSLKPPPVYKNDADGSDNLFANETLVVPIISNQQPTTTISIPIFSVGNNNITNSRASTSTTICDIKPTGSRTHHHHHHRSTRKGINNNRAIIITEDTESSMLLSDQDSQQQFKGEVQESDNSQQTTSIIKYIIDQTGKTEELPHGDPHCRWILPDGRTIPVYSSFTQVIPNKSKDGRQRASESSKIVGGADDIIGLHITPEKVAATGVSFNLMTDEQIPPRGEISEFEESNTSSLVSEDSKAGIKVAHNAATSSKRKSDNVVPKQKPKPRRRRQNEIPAGGGQFLCYECPVMKTFKSLFELIGHKVKLHPAINITEQIISDDNASSSIPNLLPINLLSLPKEEDIQEEGEGINIVPVKAPKKEFFCVYCNSTFDNKIWLAKHMESDHGDKPLTPIIFECNTCGKTFNARTNLRKHLMVHKERKHVCTTCSKGFTSNFKLLEHARVHTKIYPFECDKCDKKYRTPSLLNQHLKTVHVPESERPAKPKIEFYCGICHKILRSKRSYFCHIKTHQASPQKCPYCCETFSRQSVLVRHIRVSHDAQYESSECKECPICQRKLHPNSLIKHMRIHANEKPYPCQVCSKSFRTFANLSSHSWSHTNGERPFKCRVCPKSYLFKRTLEHHMMVHKRRTLHYVCNECGVRFTNKVNMKRHLEEHYSEKKYKCKTCGKKFQRNYYLLEHERTHTGLKPYLCNICGKASTTKSNHRAHIKIHDARDATSQEG